MNVGATCDWAAFQEALAGVGTVALPMYYTVVVVGIVTKVVSAYVPSVGVTFTISDVVTEADFVAACTQAKKVTALT